MVSKLLQYLNEFWHVGRKDGFIEFWSLQCGKQSFKEFIEFNLLRAKAIIWLM